jgi:7,8-dihydropterin-6-yl-methyl-4-(beta-D-ribofuranosyl)aminobenzene 5'-phosphate synthase
MKYLVLITVHQDEVESYLTSWNTKIPSEIEVLEGPNILYESIEDAQSFIIIETKQLRKAAKFCQNLQGIKSLKITPILEKKKALEELVKFEENKKQANSDYENTKIEKLKVGTTHRLEILPIIDWHTNNEELETETGVAYLIKTDESAILFDLALNPKESHPSPLLNNMKRLGIKLKEIDSIFITHNHGDHIGGGKWYEDETFSVSGEQIDLGKIKAYTPIKMKYPGIEPIHSPDPFILSKGLASIGTIPNSMFGYGYTVEMGIAVNVEDKGIVLIIGCGHQGLPRILERYSALFDEPLYGIIGGLHYPVMGGPLEIFGYFPHKHGGTGKVPWEQITVDELMSYIKILKSHNPELVALSPHDSSKFSLDAFRDAFQDEFVEIVVGTPIILE